MGVVYHGMGVAGSEPQRAPEEAAGRVVGPPASIPASRRVGNPAVAGGAPGAGEAVPLPGLGVWA